MMMFDAVLKALILLNAVGYMTGMSVIAFEIVLFHISVACLFCAALLSKAERNIPPRFFVFFIAVAMFNVVMRGMHPQVAFEALNYFLGAMAVYMIATYTRCPEDCFKYVLHGVLINLVVLGFQKFGYSPLFKGLDHGYPGSVMANAPRLTTYLALTMPLLFWINKLWIFPVMGVGLIYGDIQLAPLLMGVVFVAYGLKNLPKRLKVVIYILMGVLLVGSAIFMRDKLDAVLQSRLKIWSVLFWEFFNAPIAGIGFGTDLLTRKAEGSSDITYFSSILQYMATAGLAGWFFLWAVLKRFWERFDWSLCDMVIVTLLIAGMVEYPFEVKRFWILISFMIGFYLIKKWEMPDYENK